MVPSVGRGDSATSWQSHTDLARGVRARERRVARAASDDTRGLRRVRRGGSGALAWASILGSYSLFRQMAHVSAPCEPRGASARGVPGARHACSGRESTAGAGGRAGGAHRCKCPKTKTSRRSCPGERHRAQTPSLRPGCSHRREPTRHGAGAAPFLHDEAGPLLAVLLHLHLLIVRHDPPVQTATTRDASVRRTASRVRSRSFCARAAAVGEVCVRMARGRGSRVCRHARRVWQHTWHLHSAFCDMLDS